ncbi:CPBP family intramembrane glutamic endopeptidase [Granulicella sp. S190]|uniref:CPBP family intramembrane glutamic endopeptidase n=1 Tax=Granulicella sp. S190 TaxID=1747226 RepID=UPI00131B3740|nr:CPBP family intramembrane glutamic endopeptidase [Granulicella sp. S190]
MQTNINEGSSETTHSPTDLHPIEPDSTLRRVFFGADGLRAGWSLLLFIAMMAAFLYGANLITHKLHPPTHHETADHTIPFYWMLLNESVPLLGVVLVTWVMSKIERRAVGVYGLGGISKLRHFAAGLAFGVLCLTPFIFMLWKTGFLVFDSRLLFGSDIARYGLQWLGLFLVVGLLEEYLTRGYLQYTLTRGLNGFFRWAFKTPHSNVFAFWTSALFFSTLFGLVHGTNPGESPIGLLTAGLASMMFCLVLWRTGSLWWAIGFHTTWDWGQSFLYGVADSGIMVQHHLMATHPVGKPLLSGGTTGPEGSILILPIMVMIVLVIIFTLPRTNAGYTSLAGLPEGR